MASEFTHPPERYLAESAVSSRIWNLWLPVGAFFLVPFIAWYNEPFFRMWFASEQTGILEFIHFFFPLLTGLIALRLLFTPLVRGDNFLILWCSLMVVGGIFLAGEEASWGQHYFEWATPDTWQGVNDQQETNLHNVSNLLDQLPRGILLAGIFITCVIYPWLLINRPGLLPRRFDFTYPPIALRPLALLIVAASIYRLVKKSGYVDGYLNYRPGEFQELFIVWLLLYYALFLYWRERSLHR